MHEQLALIRSYFEYDHFTTNSIVELVDMQLSTVLDVLKKRIISPLLGCSLLLVLHCGRRRHVEQNVVTRRLNAGVCSNNKRSRSRSDYPTEAGRDVVEVKS